MVSPHEMRLLDRGRVYRFDASSRRFVRHDSLLIDDEGYVLSLDAREVGGGIARVDLDGATVLPAFADCHVHLTDAGYFIGERDLAGARTYDAFAAAVARAPNEGGVVFAGQYDDATWLDGRVADALPLERFHADARAMLARIDGHSCIVNRATLAWLSLGAETDGVELDADGTPTGRLALAANWRAQTRFLAEMPLQRRREAERRAADLALTHGALHLHAQLYGFERSEYRAEIDAMRALPVAVYPKVCEADPRLAVELSLPYIGGDVFLDGSLGSRTAALAHAYADAPGSGSLRFSDDELEAFFAESEGLGVAAGVHAIGDAAIEQCVRAWERVLRGAPSPRGVRHFIEHAECATRAQIDACACMGIALSVQPLFDATWGGDGGMYEARLGRERMRAMNAFATMMRSGALVCGGDDAPVCALDPLAGMQAFVEHHQREERIGEHEALAAYTVHAARLVYAERETGNLEPALSADLVVLDRDPLAGERFNACTVLQTWRRGAVAFSQG